MLFPKTKSRFSVAFDSGRAHFVCAVVLKYSSPLSRVRWFMSESDTIVYTCIYYDIANRIQNIYCRHCSELLLLRCINLIIVEIQNIH